MNIGSFFAQLGFDVDEGNLGSFEAAIEAARNVALGLGAALVAASVGVVAFVGHVADGLDDLGDFAEREQVAVEAIQELGHAAQLTGSDLEAVKNSISGVNKTIGEAVLGIGRGAKTFEKLKLSAKNADGTVKTFDQLLAEVSDKMQGLSRQEQIAMAAKLGIDSGLVPLLAKGSAAIATLRAEAQAFGVATQADTEIAGAFNDALDRSKFVALGLARSIGVQLMPALTNIIDGLRNWVVQNKEVIKSSIAKALSIVLDVVGFLTQWTWRLISGLTSLVGWFAQTQVAAVLAAAGVGLLLSWMTGHLVLEFAAQIRVLVAWIRALNLAALVVPIVIGAIVIAIGLLVDDFINFKEGNESFIGDMVKQFPELLGIIEMIEAGVKEFVAFWQVQWGFLKGPLGDLFKALGELARVLFTALWPVLQMVIRGWGQLASVALPIIIEIARAIVELLTGAITGWILILTGLVNGLIFAASTIQSVFTTVAGAVKSLIDGAMALIDKAKQKVTDLFSSVANAVRSVGRLLGLSDSEISVKTAPAVAASAMSAPMPSATKAAISAVLDQPPSMALPGAVDYSGAGSKQAGILGRAAVGVGASPVTTNNTTTIQVPSINITAPDAAAAGESVRSTLSDMNRTATRNGQSAVTI